MIRFLTDSDTELYEKCKKLCVESFPDTEESFVIRFFDECTRPENILCCIENDELVAAIRMQQRVVYKNGKKLNAALISWVCVRFELWGHGYGKKLMQFAIDQQRQMNTSFVFLSPVDAEIVPFYEKLGFGISAYANQTIFTDTCDRKPIEWRFCASQALRLYNKSGICVVRNEEYFEKYSHLYFAYSDERMYFFGTYEIGKYCVDDYAFDEEKCTLSEVLDTMFAVAQPESGEVFLRVDESFTDGRERITGRVPYMMVLPFDGGDYLDFFCNDAF